MKLKFITLTLFVFSVFTLAVSAQTSPSAGVIDDGGIELVSIIIPEGTTYLSRYNLRVYENNSYRGLRYVEISGQLTREASGDKYDSSFWQISETSHDLRAVVAGVDQMDKYSFTTDELTYSRKPLSGGYPSHLYHFPEYRNFPVLPSAVLYRLSGPGIPPVGTRYEAMAYRLVDPEGDGRFTPVQVYVQYEYQGTGEYLGEQVHFFRADFALRSDGRLTGFAVQGSNSVRIAVFPGDNTRIFMNNSIKEQYGLSGGKQIRLEGFGLTWIKSPRPVLTDPLFLRGIASLPGTTPANTTGPTGIASTSPGSGPASPADSRPADASAPSASSASSSEAASAASAADVSSTGPSASAVAGAEPAPGSTESPADSLPPGVPSRISSEGGDIEVNPNPLGLSLNLPDIQFEADSANLLPGENKRIERLAELLKQLPDRRFLVVGHTADVGNPAGQQQLSVLRARTVAQMLADLGIPPGAIRYEGRGATEPVGDNATSEGRAANRRVEVIILN